MKLEGSCIDLVREDICIEYICDVLRGFIRTSDSGKLTSFCHY